MNKILKLALVTALFVPFFASAQTVAFGTNLSYGSTGADVIALQEFLTDQQVYTGPISGNFYSLTLAAVKRFQKAEGISPVSGYVGPITRGTINTLIVAPDSEEDATTSTPVDLSTTTVPVIPTYTPPQIIYVQVPTSVQSQAITPIVPEIQSAPEIVPTSMELVTSYPNNQIVLPNLYQRIDYWPNICNAVTLWLVVFDQNGNIIPNASATFVNPDTQVSTTNEWYQYTSPATSTTKIINYSSGSLNGSYSITFGPLDSCSN